MLLQTKHLGLSTRWRDVRRLLPKYDQLIFQAISTARMTSEGSHQESDEGQRYPKTHAKELYCLTDKDISPLSAKEKRNPYVRNGTPMKLYKQTDLEEAAIQKWGSLKELEEEKNKRVEKKEKKALEKAKEADQDVEEQELRNGEEDARNSDTVIKEGQLHPLIEERIQILRSAKGTSSGKYVLYWMHTAVRSEQNPALDVALNEATKRQLPLLVASFLLKSHTYPTHRRYKFLLEGLRDAQGSLASKGISHLVFVEGLSMAQDGSQADGWTAVMQAVADAALVVTEIMPTPPYTTWKKDLVQQAPDHTDVWAVDTACLVPVTLFKKSYAKAYAFRSATSKMRDERLKGLPYPSQTTLELDAEGSKKAAESVPWGSIDLTTGNVDIQKMLKKTDAFDSSVPGVTQMPGGQTAGYARWEAFKKNGLSQYAARRNNAMLRSGVSRMSAYHHFGMVSPFRVARDAAAGATNGARKFADEFLTWRELAYLFCHHNSDILETLQVLPAWSQKTLAAHKSDKRELKTQEQLEEGTTGDEIWDALQHQLNTTGELHNNVRMTWGKALLPWTSDPETALKQTIHLNHKFAMDGCDPSSYGGILWCYGQFDGPKGAESTPIFGSLRNRPTHWLTRKLNAERFRNLPLDGPPVTSGGGATTAADPGAGEKDIRNLFANAGHQSEDRLDPPSPKEAHDGSADLNDPPIGRKRGAKGQPGIEAFFKRSK